MTEYSKHSQLKYMPKKKYLAFMVGDSGGVGGSKRTSTFEKVDLIKTLHINFKNTFILEHKTMKSETIVRK